MATHSRKHPLGLSLLALSSMATHCDCPEQAVLPATWEIEQGNLSMMDGSGTLTFDMCRLTATDSPHFTTEVETRLHVECGEMPVQSPVPGQELFRLELPLGDLRKDVGKTIDLVEYGNAMYSANGVAVAPTPPPYGSIMTVTEIESVGGPAPYPTNVTDDFLLRFRIEVAIPGFNGGNGDFFPGATMEVGFKQVASDYRRDPGPDPSCI